MNVGGDGTIYLGGKTISKRMGQSMQEGTGIYILRDMTVNFGGKGTKVSKSLLERVIT